MDGWMDGQMDGWMDGWMDRSTHMRMYADGQRLLNTPLRPPHTPRTRTNTQRSQGLSTAEVWMAAERELGMPAQAVPPVTEQDAWTYRTWKGTPDGGRARAVGRSMVCCVFVCGCVSA